MAPPRKLRASPLERVVRTVTRMSWGTLGGRAESASPSRKASDTRVSPVPVASGHIHVDPDTDNFVLAGIGEGYNRPDWDPGSSDNMLLGDVFVDDGASENVVVSSAIDPWGIDVDSIRNTVIGPGGYLIGSRNAMVGALFAYGDDCIGIGDGVEVGDAAGYSDYPTDHAIAIGRNGVNTGTWSMLLQIAGGNAREFHHKIANDSMFLGGLIEWGGADFIYNNTHSPLSFAANSLVPWDATAGACVFNLPAITEDDGSRDFYIAGQAPGVWYIIMKLDSSANTVTVNADAADSIQGAASKVLTAQYDYVHLVAIKKLLSSTPKLWFLKGGRIGGTPV